VGGQRERSRWPVPLPLAPATCTFWKIQVQPTASATSHCPVPHPGHHLGRPRVSSPAAAGDSHSNNYETVLLTAHAEGLQNARPPPGDPQATALSNLSPHLQDQSHWHIQPASEHDQARPLLKVRGSGDRGLGVVAHICHLSSLRAEELRFKAILGKKLARPHLNKQAERGGANLPSQLWLKWQSTEALSSNPSTPLKMAGGSSLGKRTSELTSPGL
jgi:hypothetical protein